MALPQDQMEWTDAMLELENVLSFSIIDSVAAAVTLSADNFIVICDVTSAGFDVTLPEITRTMNGKVYHIKNNTTATGNVLRVVAGGTDTIDLGSGANTSPLTIADNARYIFVADFATTDWVVLSNA
jgi:hypothetical protein